jgi:L-histidine N-alpha-methyltransferase
LRADFTPERFRHVARWDAAREWIEMSLRSRERQRVRIAALDLSVDFLEGEELRTEISAKFTYQRLHGELAAAGMAPVGYWTDPAQDYAVSLWRPRALRDNQTRHSW